MIAKRTALRRPGFSLIELLVVMAIIGILASLLLPALRQGQARARRIGCISGLRQAGIAFQSFAHDHNGQFPMMVAASSGGSEEFTTSSYQLAGHFFFSFRHFQALSNDLASPKVLACPADTREPAANFAGFSNSNLSYFVGLQADMSKPYSILAGDRNITNDLVRFSTLVRPQFSRGWRWTSELHQFEGNLLFADVHVEQKTSQALNASLGQPQLAGELSLPDVPRPATVGQGVAGLYPGAPGVPIVSPRPQTPAVASGAQNQPQIPTPPAQPSPGIGSIPVSLPQGSWPAALASQEPGPTNGGGARKHPAPAPPGPAEKEKPGANPEPGFSFFPAWVATATFDLMKLLAWLLLLALLIAAAVLVVRRRSHPHQQVPGGMKRPPDDASPSDWVG